jgi:hypothetical protein
MLKPDAIIPADLVSRYAPGGDIFAKIAEHFGTDGANRIYKAARSRIRYKVTEAICLEKYGEPLPT